MLRRRKRRRTRPRGRNQQEDTGVLWVHRPTLEESGNVRKVCLKQVGIEKKTGGGEILLKQPNVSFAEAEVAQLPQTTGEETGKEGSKPANGTSEGSSNSQSGAGKKVQALRAGFHSRKSPNRLP